MEKEVIDEMEEIIIILEKSLDYELTAEVVWSALKAMKENPSLSIIRAINIGFEEWIK